jgi:hypothetical protein
LRAKIIIDRTGSAWQSAQVEEPCILPNPKDPSRLIMFYSGVSAANREVAAVGKAWALASDPWTWHQDGANPIFCPSAAGWDSGSIRLDTVLYVAEEDSYYLYYSGTEEVIQDRIGLAICPAGADGYSAVGAAMIVRWGDRPVLAPEPAAPFHEEMASQAGVIREWNPGTREWDWHLYYSYRGRNGILPGIRRASSRDGKTWVRHWEESDPRKMGHIFPSTPGAYYEWHQAGKIGRTYFLCMEVGPESGKRWRAALAVSLRPTGGWVPLDLDLMLQTRWPEIYSDTTLYHVATPALYDIGGRWYLFVQACARPASGNYIDGSWEMWCIECTRSIVPIAGSDPMEIP